MVDLSPAQALERAQAAAEAAQDAANAAQTYADGIADTLAAGAESVAQMAGEYCRSKLTMYEHCPNI